MAKQLAVISPWIAHLPSWLVCLPPRHVSANRVLLKLLESSNFECFPAGIRRIWLKETNLSRWTNENPWDKRKASEKQRRPWCVDPVTDPGGPVRVAFAQQC